MREKIMQRLIGCCLIVLFVNGWAFGQQPAPNAVESHKYRTILTVAGGGGGFVLGLLTGLSVFDDAVNSDRKVWTTALAGAGGGAVGGYFIGRALDKRGRKTVVNASPFTTPQEALTIAPILSDEKKGVALTIRF
jgi:hypothetical protein